MKLPFLILILILSSSMLIYTVDCYPYESTEAQRQYDLAISYIKSDLYEDGLKTLNQVAFLYTDSDVADDAIYQLALIREQVGDNKLAIGESIGLNAVKGEMERLTGITKYDIPTLIVTILKYENIMSQAKQSSIAQYILALDYLSTLVQRYPNSDKKEDADLLMKRLAIKINNSIKKPDEPEPLSIGGVILFVIVILGVLALYNKYNE